MQRDGDPVVATGVPVAASGKRGRLHSESDGERKDEARETHSYLRRRIIKTETEEYELVPAPQPEPRAPPPPSSLPPPPLPTGASRAAVESSATLDEAQHGAECQAVSEEPTEQTPPALSGGSHGRSREEFSVGGYMLYGLDMPVGRDDVLRVIEHGDSCGLVDVGIPLGTTNYTLLLDWDGAAYHGPGRLDGDVRKTRRMLALDRGDGAKYIVVRVREQTSPAFPTALEDPTLAGVLVVIVTSKHPGKILQQMAAQLAPLLPEPFGSTLLRRARGARVAEVDAAVDAAWAHVDAMYREQLRQLQAFIGSGELAKKLLGKHGVKTRISAVMDAIRSLIDKGVRMDDIVKFHDCFWSAVGEHPGELSAFMDRSVQRGIPVERFHSMGDSFWSAGVNKPDELSAFMDRSVQRGVPVERFHSMGNSFWSAGVNKPDKLSAFMDRSVQKGVPVERFHSMGGSFWSAGVNKPDELSEFMDRSVQKGVPVERLHSMGGSFWSAGVNKPDELSAFMDRIVQRGVPVERFHSMRDSFWSAGVKRSIETNDLVDVLINEYGIKASNLSVFYDPFWAKYTKRDDLDALVTRLAGCKTTGAVNKVVHELNRGCVGEGARWCKFVRPVLEHEKVIQPKKTTQTTLTSLFGRK